MDFHARFRFTSTPFTREIPVDRLFELPYFTEVVAAVIQATEQRASCAVLAPAGAGKTVVGRTVAARLPEARYRTRYTKMTGLSKRDLCREIAFAMGVAPAGSYNFLVRRIQEAALADTDNDAVRSVLILDDAHELRPDVLGMLRALTNFSMDSKLVLSLILLGQPPLAAMLRLPQHEDIARRLVHYAVLGPLSRDEVQQYLTHRCTVVGAVDLPFDAQAIDAIYEIGRGNLRGTDVLALKSLEVADRRDRNKVDSSCVVEARKLAWP